MRPRLDPGHCLERERHVLDVFLPPTCGVVTYRVGDERRAQTFPLKEGDRCEILILVLKEDEPPLIDESKTIAAHLLGNPEGAIARRIRRITVASVRLEPGARPSFSLRYSEPSSSHSPSESTRTG
jgi:hypothetical protein